MRTVGRRRGWHVAAGSGWQRLRLGGGRAAGVLPRGGRRRAAGCLACCCGGVAHTAAAPRPTSPAPLYA